MAQIGMVFKVPQKVEQVQNYCLFQDIAVTTMAKPGVSKWGVKGEGTGGGAPLPLGSFSAFFQTKITTLTPVLMPVDFGKVPNPFDF
jgi:hypothetical protein